MMVFENMLSEDSGWALGEDANFNLNSDIEVFDLDGDGNIDSFTMETDINGDGIDDIVQAFDNDGDGRFETTQISLDTNNDGEIDLSVIEADLNGDGIVDQTSVVQAVDNNRDGLNDTWSIQTDVNGDGIVDESMVVTDTDLDGAADTRLAANQTAVGNLSSADNNNQTSLDLDGDGVNETVYREIDTDGDGRIDSGIYESDVDGDGQVDYAVIGSDIDGDGVIDRTSYVEAVDTDGDGQKDTWAVHEDRNNDGIIDESAVVADTDGDGLADTQLAANQESVKDSDIIGDPESDMANWHQQTKSDTCAVACQEFILDEMSGRDFTEAELTQQAIDNGWYTPGAGTPVECVGNLLEANGIEIEKEYNCNLDDISAKLDDGENIIVGIDADETWYPGGLDSDKILANVSGMPEQGANHAVQVIGIDNSDPDNPVVILNDPGIPNGRGIRVDADDFMDAWSDSNNFMVSTVS